MIYQDIISRKVSNVPCLAVLIDPDKYNPDLLVLANTCRVSYILVGGSKLHSGNLQQTIRSIKKKTTIPIIIFPGDEKQVAGGAAAILLPSVISGRNAEYLIGKQVIMAPQIKKNKLEVMPTGYILIDGGRTSTTQKVTRTKPIFPGSLQLIKDTALAGEMMGMKLIYLEAGSGAGKKVPARVIREVKKVIQLPLIVGGGIDSASRADEVIKAGANVVVVGNALERKPELLLEISKVFN